MSSSKKKTTSDQIPKPISIKKEKSEEDRTLHPISHYIDDRLELVKQIFGTLKPKTIMNLAPEFLKKTSLDEIEELCLNELLCISTKRLKSIIEDTRCPTDTESSEDSDVEHKEEHISLEEISSDSDIGGNDNRRAKKSRKANTKRADKNNENKEPDGPISVLELLELQARARAIRSQLAMEPITKIEVKSDDDDEPSVQSSKDKISKEKRSHKSANSGKRKSSEETKESSKSQSQPQPNGKTAKEVSAPQKKIKLKRNYRNPTKSPEKQLETQPAATKKPEVVEQNHKSRSASPDVIPIPAEPETLLISDSTDEDEEKQVSKKQETKLAEVESQPTVEPVPAELSEPEEGEVRDDIEAKAEAESESQTTVKSSEEEKPEENSTDTPDDVEPIQDEAAVDKPEPAEEAGEGVSCSKETPQTNVSAEQPLSVNSVDDEDQNDDVISIGGDLEMIEELAKVEDEPVVKVKSEAPEILRLPDEEDNDVISLNTSEDEHEKLEEPTSSESWRTRYLKSSKVSQVLAESRFGKRVRDKIKKSKRAEKHSESKETGDEKASQQQQQFTSKHEDGSMEQYQELLQHRQRKSSNSGKGDK